LKDKNLFKTLALTGKFIIEFDGADSNGNPTAFQISTSQSSACKFQAKPNSQLVAELSLDSTLTLVNQFPCKVSSHDKASIVIEDHHPTTEKSNNHVTKSVHIT